MNRIITTNDAPTLDDLAELLNEREATLDDETRLEDVVDLAVLPTYGGAEPTDTAGVYSWDAERWLVPGNGWTVEARQLTEIEEVTAILDDRGIDYDWCGGDGIYVDNALKIESGDGLSWWLVYGRVSPIDDEESGAIDTTDDLDQALALLSTVATTEQIEALRDESRGYDPEQVSLCDAALEGDRAAYRECVDVIADARAQHDD